MELKIIKNEKNEVLGRAEIVAEVVQKTVPSRSEVTKNLAAQLSETQDKIIVAKVENEFGQEKIIVHARIYDDLETMNKTEKKYMLTKNETKKEEAPAESAEAINEAETENNEIAEQAVNEEKKEEAQTAEAINEAKEETKEKPVEEKKEEVKAEEKPAEEKKKGEETN